MLHNTGKKFYDFVIPEPSQEEIYNLPHYSGLSSEQIKKQGAPDWLLKILDRFPWSDKPNVCQIRPQDFRTKRPEVVGSYWHCDNSVKHMDGSTRGTFDLSDFRLFSLNFGNVCQTEFIDTPWEFKNHYYTHHKECMNELHGEKLQKHYEVVSSTSGQIGEYTPLDFHRASPKHSLGKLRLFFVIFESNSVFGSEWIRPSIREQDEKLGILNNPRTD